MQLCTRAHALIAGAASCELTEALCLSGDVDASRVRPEVVPSRRRTSECEDVGPLANKPINKAKVFSCYLTKVAVS